jgi:hypothetical protein
MSGATAATTIGQVQTERGPSLPFIIGASSCGTLIEWYDFYLYGVLAPIFATHFFPGDLKNSNSK